MNYALPVLAFLLGGLGRRIAGGALNQWAGLPGGVNGRVMGDTPARFIYAGLIAACALLAGGSWKFVPAIVLGTWAGSTTGNFNSIGMGRGGNTLAHDYWGMTAHGTICAALILLALFATLFCPTVVMPRLMGLAAYGFMLAPEAYMLAWIITGRTGRKWLPVGLRTGSDLAELIWGGFCGLGVYAAFL